MEPHHKLLSLLDEELGAGKPTTKDNYIYYCPVCKWHNPKLEIDIVKEWWHCWRCSTGGKSIFSLLKFIRAVGKTYEKFKEYNRSHRQNPVIATENNIKVGIQLPKEYIPLWHVDNDNWFWRSAINYLICDRKIRMVDVIKYRIGYCLEGPYKHMLIFPNYNQSGELDYFSGRAFLPNFDRPHKAPKIDKDIIGFEMFIDWEEPIIIVESVLNAITLRRNATPTFGKSIPEVLKMKILQKHTPEIIMGYDGDAIVENIRAIEYFMGLGIVVRLMPLAYGTDINELGYDASWQIIDNTPVLTTDDVFLLKSKLLLNEDNKNIPHSGYTSPLVHKTRRIPSGFRKII